jgi:hypothetical protein
MMFSLIIITLPKKYLSKIIQFLDDIFRSARKAIIVRGRYPKCLMTGPARWPRQPS